MVMGGAVEWRTHHESAACTSEACRPAGQFPAQSESELGLEQEKTNKRNLIQKSHSKGMDMDTFVLLASPKKLLSSS